MDALSWTLVFGVVAIVEAVALGLAVLQVLSLREQVARLRQEVRDLSARLVR